MALTLARTGIDKEIIRQKSILLGLYTWRNSFSLICLLPTELLATIFIICARDHHEAHVTSDSCVPYWVHLSYVCRHWRNVALNCPDLWTYVFVVSQRWTKELLARSKQAPLKIVVTFGATKNDSWWLNFVEKVMDHVERIQKFRLYLLPTWKPSVSSATLFNNLSSRAPRLQNLAIFVEGLAPTWSSVLFHGDTPALRTLELVNCPVPWYLSRPMSRLTTLSLDNVPVQFQPNMAELLAMLSGMQDLTYLYLDRALASARGFVRSEESIASSKFDFPRLSRLLIVAPLSAVVALLSCINIPTKTEVRLQCELEHDSSLDDCTLFSSLLAQRISTSEVEARPGSTIRSLVAQLGVWRLDLIFSALERDCDFDFSLYKPPLTWGRNIPLEITVIGLNQPNNWDRIISGICCSTPLSGVRSLHIAGSLFPSDFWRKMLASLQDLRYIKLSDGNMPDLAPVLSLAPHDSIGNQGEHVDRGSNQMIAPALEELELHSIRLSANPESDLHPPAADRQSLYEALSTRKDPRCRLTMIRCVVKDSVRRLQAAATSAHD